MAAQSSVQPLQCTERNCGDAMTSGAGGGISRHGPGWAAGLSLSLHLVSRKAVGSHQAGYRISSLNTLIDEIHRHKMQCWSQAWVAFKGGQVFHWRRQQEEAFHWPLAI